MGGRAAELARRMQSKSAAGREGIAASPLTPMPITASEAEMQSLAPVSATAVMEPLTPLHIEESEPLATSPSDSVSHLFGVRQTSQGVLFVQPSTGPRALAIAGEFNHWSPTATPLRLNAAVGVFEALVKLPPGSYQYRVVIDGQWLADSHNPCTQLNSYGEPNSVVTVR